MAAAVTIAFFGFVLEDDQFLAASLPIDGCQYLCIVDEGRTNLGVIGIGDQQHVERDLCTNLNGEPIHFELLAHGNLILSSTTFNNCKHVFPILLVNRCALSGGYLGGIGGE